VVRQIAISLRMLLVTTVILGVAYPLVIGAAGLLFGGAPAGSLVRDAKGTVVGSAFIGQRFDSPKYFHGRPSAAGDGYDAMASSGSNLGPTSAKLAAAVEARVKQAEADDPSITGQVPADMVTSSGSGLDPDISPANAYAQVKRVARLRGLSDAAVTALVDRTIAGRQLGVLGEPRVNVLTLNMALDQLAAVR
jgi:potassium-transporting ATPase KdpC subunit